jgi:Tfp pilus assembly protein PilF
MEGRNRIELLKKMLKEEPEDAFLNYALGLEYLKDSENSVLAELQFRKVTEVDPKYMAAFYQLAKLLQSHSKITEALQYYHLGLEIAEKKKDQKAIGEFLEAIFLLED